jgi:hypothetical protein
MADDNSDSSPVHGEVIESSTKGLLEWIYSGIGCLAVAFAVIWLWWNEVTVFLITPRKVAVWTVVLAVGVAGFGVFAIGKGCYLLSNGVKQRLIIGDDRFQLVRRVAGRDHVLCQLLYANIASISCEKLSAATAILITLKDPDNPDNAAARRRMGMNVGDGRHLCLANEYSTPIEAIYQKLAARYKNQ